MSTAPIQQTYDVVVIGAGPGGYICAIRLGQFGKKTLVVEKDALGGVCLNIGCIPSKALIHASKVYKKAKEGGNMGVIADGIRVDMAKMQSWKTGITSKLSGGIGGLFKGNKVDHVFGTAKLAGPGQVSITLRDGSTQTVRTTDVVLATGSSPIQIPGFAYDGQTIVDSTGALAFAEVPKALAVIGGGVIGLELADVYARLGSQVTVLEAADKILPAFDADLVQPVVRKQQKLGVQHWTKAKALGWNKTADGRAAVQVEVSEASGPVNKTLEVDKVLVAVGRKPNSAGLGLETVGLQADGRGFVAVDKFLKTKVKGIYAIGDLVGQPMLAHKASKDGEVCAEVIAGHKGAELDVACIPNVVYTDPEIATVGPMLFELQAAGKQVKTGKFAFAALGRAMTAEAPDGFARMITDETGRILAVQVVGAEASELIAQAGLAVEMAATAEDVALTVHAHPTMAEAMLEAALAATGHPLHQLPPRA